MRGARVGNRVIVFLGTNDILQSDTFDASKAGLEPVGHDLPRVCGCCRDRSAQELPRRASRGETGGRAVTLHPAPARAVAQQPGRAGPPPDQAPDRADARVSELLDRQAHPGRGGGDGDAGEGTGACRACQRHARPARLRAPGVWPRHLSEGERARARPQSANATDPDQALRISRPNRGPHRATTFGRGGSHDAVAEGHRSRRSNSRYAAALSQPGAPGSGADLLPPGPGNLKGAQAIEAFGAAVTEHHHQVRLTTVDVAPLGRGAGDRDLLGRRQGRGGDPLSASTCSSGAKSARIGRFGPTSGLLHQGQT